MDAAAVERHVLATRAVERLASTVAVCAAWRELVQGVVEIEPAVAPELTAILEGLEQASEATIRAIQFIGAKLDTETEQAA